MQTTPPPEIEASDLEAARQFLTSSREDEKETRAARQFLAERGPVVRHGITRARTRSARTGAGA